MPTSPSTRPTITVTITTSESQRRPDDELTSPGFGPGSFAVQLIFATIRAMVAMPGEGQSSPMVASARSFTIVASKTVASKTVSSMVALSIASRTRMPANAVTVGTVGTIGTIGTVATMMNTHTLPRLAHPT